MAFTFTPVLNTQGINQRMWDVTTTAAPGDGTLDHKVTDSEYALIQPMGANGGDCYTDKPYIKSLTPGTVDPVTNLPVGSEVVIGRVGNATTMSFRLIVGRTA
jgi:hypothetical protein